MIKSFIDTNVFVHWIVLSTIKQGRPEDKELWTEFKKIKPSYELLERIKDTSLKTDFSFYTSSLSISEIFYSLLDEYRCRHMHRDGVPLSRWQTTKTKFNLTIDEREELTDDVIKFLNEFDIFTPLEGNKKVNLLSTEHFDYNLLSKLVLENKIRTHDAILISTAVNYGCQYFITEDKPLRDKKIFEITTIHPEKMLHLLKQRFIEPSPA